MVVRIDVEFRDDTPQQKCEEIARLASAGVAQALQTMAVSAIVKGLVLAQ